MDPYGFSDALDKVAGQIVSELYQFADLPQARVPEFVQKFESLLPDYCVSFLFIQMMNRLKFLGGTSQNVAAFCTMLAKLRKPFEKFETEWLSFDFVQKLGTFIPTQDIDILEDLFEKKTNNEKVN